MRHLSTIRQSCLRASFAALASVSVMKETASAIDAPLVDDVSALQQQPTFNYGGLNSLYVVGHATAARWTFLSFDPVSAVPTTTNKDDIAKATLYLGVTAA